MPKNKLELLSTYCVQSLPDKKLKLLVERFNVFVDGIEKEFLGGK